MTEVLFPLWQVDRGEYDAVCTYLDLTPSPSIHARLNAYLRAAPFKYRRPQGFSRFLAELKLTPFRLARMDLATRLIDRDHPVRHVLNAAIALHECDREGYAQLAASPVGARLLPSLMAWGVGFGWNSAITLPWLAVQFLRYAPRALAGRKQNLDGQRVLVTGVAHGLGLTVMLECLERGAKVIGTVRNEQSRLELQQSLPAEAPARLLVADLSEPGALVATLRQVDVDPRSLTLVILCAGVKYDGMSVLSTSELHDTFQINVFSTAELVAWLVAGGAFPGGHRGESPGPEPTFPDVQETADVARRTPLVLVSSMGRWHGMHSTAGYNASKAALSIWGESLAMELHRAGEKRFTVSIVEPGLFESGMTRRQGLVRFLVMSRREVARRIVCGAMAGQQVLRPPFWFAVITWAVCLAGHQCRLRLFGRAKPGGGARR